LCQTQNSVSGLCWVEEFEEFYGFTAEDIGRRVAEDDGQASGESDLSFGEETSDEEELESGDEGESDEWSRELHEVELAPFDREVGPTNILPAEANATDFLEQPFPPDLIDLIVEETNRNARRKDADRTYWEPVNASDIKIYLAIRLQQGIKSVPSERDYWATSPFLGVKSIKDVMSKNKYVKINQYLHFNDAEKAKTRGQEEHDKLFHVRPLIKRLSETFLKAYKPNRENAIDEGLIKYKGRLGFKQYMPLKPAKRGIKVWLWADSHTHYVSVFQVYAGRPKQNTAETGLGARVVTDLSRDLVGGHYHLFMDNFFSSFDLLKKLKNDGIYATATTRTNRKEFPAEVKSAKLTNCGDAYVMQRQGIHATAWKDKKKRFFFLKQWKPARRPRKCYRKGKDCTSEKVSAPPCVVTYNKHMGGVDYADQKRGDYKIPIKSRRWYRYLFIFLFETAVVNSHILRNLSPNHKKITQLDYRLELIEGLIGRNSSRKRKRASTEIEVVDGKSHFPVKVPINRCVHCAAVSERKRSTWGCALCNVTLCVGCFEPFHLK
ncbi:piggyBac transposable element-derived protein 4-like, partial [Nematostella vectensis]|uniref:piggyBac transposable element-derived protein 4-like n=1 Tax=Nematostella vectensis TaxID=45351 RepID=UPI0020775F4F